MCLQRRIQRGRYLNHPTKKQESAQSSPNNTRARLARKGRTEVGDQSKQILLFPPKQHQSHSSRKKKEEKRSAPNKPRAWAETKRRGNGNGKTHDPGVLSLRVLSCRVDLSVGLGRFVEESHGERARTVEGEGEVRVSWSERGELEGADRAGEVSKARVGRG